MREDGYFHHHFQAKIDIFGNRFHFEGKNDVGISQVRRVKPICLQIMACQHHEGALQNIQLGSSSKRFFVIPQNRQEQEEKLK